MKRRAILVVAGAMACGIAAAEAAERPSLLVDPIVKDIRGLRLGLSADHMPSGFINFACGSDGKPPLKPLRGWGDYADCAKDQKGLHEVAIEYDTVGEHLADMFVELQADDGDDGGALWLDKFVGTKVAGHPVILSVLFDDTGIVQGLRAVTDSRARVDQRQRSNFLAEVVRNHYDPSNWTCEMLPLEDGQQAIGGRYIKERCETVYRGESRMIVWRNLFRRPGQTGRNAAGEFVEGEWESSARWEVWSLDGGQDKPGQNDAIAAINPRDPGIGGQNKTPDAPGMNQRPASIAAFLAGETRDCAGCDLRGADLVRRDLSGGNLAGANLTGASLVEAKLEGTDFSKADLSEADLSLANLRRANLHDAVLHSAVLYRADLTLADLSEAYMNGGILRRARMQRANLTGAYLIDCDMRDSHLAGAILKGANLGGSVLNDANLANLDLRGVNLEVANLVSTNLAGANLEGANFRQADLYRANLSQTLLRGANFTEARLQAANILGANLEDAIFKDTILPGGEIHTGPLVDGH